MVITEITEGKRNRRYIFIDGEFSFSAFEDIIYKYSLKQGMAISEDVLIKAQDEQNFLYAKRMTFDLLSKSAFSKKGLYRKLIEKKITPENATAAVDYAAEQGYVNDMVILPDICRHLAVDKKYGARRIISYLIQKGFEKDMIEECIKNGDFQSEERILELIEKSKTDFSDRAQVAKLYAKLCRKGYSYGEIASAIRKYSDIDTDYGD